MAKEGVGEVRVGLGPSRTVLADADVVHSELVKLVHFVRLSVAG